MANTTVLNLYGEQISYPAPAASSLSTLGTPGKKSATRRGTLIRYVCFCIELYPQGFPITNCKVHKGVLVEFYIDSKLIKSVNYDPIPAEAAQV